MKYYAIIGTFVEPCPLSDPDMKKAIDGHLEYLDRGFRDGSILVSGPKSNSPGGIILVKVNSEEELREFIRNDPLALAKAQDYEAIEFDMHDCQDAVRDWFA